MRAGTVAVLLILAGFLAPALTPAAPAAAKDDKRADIRFRLRVPPNATPGDHIGEILASVTGAETNSSGQRVNVERRVAARIYLRVAGPVHAVAELAAVDVRYDNPVMPFGGGDMTVTYRLTNSGNVIVTGVARIQVKGPLGVRVANSDQIEIPELLPDSEIRLTERLSGVFPAGQLTAEVAVNPKTVEGTLPPRSQTRTVWAVPWLVLAGLGLVLLLLFLWWLRRWRARRYAALDRPDELGPTGGAVPVAAGTGKVPGVMLVALAATALAAPAVSAPAPPPVPAPDPASVEVQVSIAPAQSPAPTASPTPSPTGAPTSPAPSSPPTPPGGKLPRTGVAIGVILVAGAALVGGGTGLRLLVGRRKSP